MNMVLSVINVFLKPTEEARACIEFVGIHESLFSDSVYSDPHHVQDVIRGRKGPRQILDVLAKDLGYAMVKVRVVRYKCSVR